MSLHDAIGIDTDSSSCVVTLVQRSGTKPQSKTYSLTVKGRAELANYISSFPEVLVGIEGKRGQCTPLEEFFEESGIVFFSIPPYKIENYRKAMVGANKNNENDAQAVAEFLLDLETKNQLDRYRIREKVDQDLRLLARTRFSQAQQITALESQLWKFLKAKAGDLYLNLQGSGDTETNKIPLTSKRLLHLFIARPQLSTWADLTEEEILTLSGAKRSRGWENFVQVIQSSSGSIQPLRMGTDVILRQIAENLLRLLEQETELEKALEAEAETRPQVKTLVERYRGMGVFTASLIVEEIITIDRFPNDDHLASYAGLTKRDSSTGKNGRQVTTRACNLRLKAAFITLAKGYLLYNKDSHLERYHRNLLKQGMSKMEALKRTARALAREVYRFLKVQNQVLKKNGSPWQLTGSQLAPTPTSYTVLPNSMYTQGENS
jgi:transposase